MQKSGSRRELERDLRKDLKDGKRNLPSALRNQKKKRVKSNPMPWVTK